MKIHQEMDLGKLAQLIGPGTDNFKTKMVRDRLVLVADGRDTDDLSSRDWQVITNDVQTTSADVDRMLKASGAFWLYFNRKTGAVVHGISSNVKVGDRSIDRSWVGFEVVASTQDDAERMVRAYINHPKAKYTGMMVCIRDGFGLCADDKATPIPVVAAVAAS